MSVRSQPHKTADATMTKKTLPPDTTNEGDDDKSVYLLTPLLTTSAPNRCEKAANATARLGDMTLQRGANKSGLDSNNGIIAMDMEIVIGKVINGTSATVGKLTTATATDVNNDDDKDDDYDDYGSCAMQQAQGKQEMNRHVTTKSTGKTESTPKCREKRITKTDGNDDDDDDDDELLLDDAYTIQDATSTTSKRRTLRTAILDATNNTNTSQPAKKVPPPKTASNSSRVTPSPSNADEADAAALARLIQDATVQHPKAKNGHTVQLPIYQGSAFELPVKRASNYQAHFPVQVSNGNYIMSHCDSKSMTLTSNQSEQFNNLIVEQNDEVIQLSNEHIDKEDDNAFSGRGSTESTLSTTKSTASSAT